jgi:hypothetical protein
MDRRFDTRLRDMLAQAEVSPELIDGLLSRLETFVHPFTASLLEPEQHRHTLEYVTGLLSKLEHKTGEGIAYLHDQERQGITRSSHTQMKRVPGRLDADHNRAHRRTHTNAGE